MRTPPIYNESHKVVAYSGGKDSTAMLLRLIEEKAQVDAILWYDTGWEFPILYAHNVQVQELISRSIMVIKPRRPFLEEMIKRPIVARKGPLKGQVHRIGQGWPSPFRRWCTRSKHDDVQRICGKATQYIGIAANEKDRAAKVARLHTSPTLFPLIDWGMTEADCLAYCKARGLTWAGHYDHFARLSCYCCPMQRMEHLRMIRRAYPELWNNMLTWDRAMAEHNHGFKEHYTVQQLTERFAAEDQAEADQQKT